MVDRPQKPDGAVSYVSSRPAYVGGVYREPGAPFSTTAPPGVGWTPTGEDRGTTARVNRTTTTTA